MSNIWKKCVQILYVSIRKTHFFFNNFKSIFYANARISMLMVFQKHFFTRLVILDERTYTITLVSNFKILCYKNHTVLLLLYYRLLHIQNMIRQIAKYKQTISIKITVLFNNVMGARRVLDSATPSRIPRLTPGKTPTSAARKSTLNGQTSATGRGVRSPSALSSQSPSSSTR